MVCPAVPETAESDERKRFMSLTFVLGSSGSGKSTAVYRRMIRESMAHPEGRYLVLVPEQFTLQTQKDLSAMHPQHGLFNIDVLSFNRLAWRVFEEVGGDDRPVLEEIGKSLVIQKVVSEANRRKSLGVLGSTLKRHGSVSEMKSLVSELLQYRVKPSDLSDWQTELSGQPLLSEKLGDVQRVYQDFEEYLSRRYLTVEEVPEILCGVIGRSELVAGSTVILDGFTGFTPVQNEVVRHLLALAGEVVVVVTMDERMEGRDLDRHPVRMHQLFYMSSQLIRTVSSLAREVHTEIREPVWIKRSDRSRFAGNPPMDYLEQNLFRYGARPFGGRQDAVRIVEAADPGEELRYVTGEIRRLMREGTGSGEPMHYRDFAIVTGDLEQYQDTAARLLEQERIPYFLDSRRSVMGNPAVEFVRSAVDMIARNFSYESVFRFLRTGLTDFTEDEIDRMENYVLALGIRRWKQYEEKWLRPARYLEENLPEIERLDALRARFAGEISDFRETVRDRNRTVREKTGALYRLLRKYRIQEKMEARADAFSAAGDMASAKEYRQVYPAVIALLDKLVEVLGDEKMPMEDYLKVLEAGFDETAVGLIPPGKDQVLIGDIERTRLKHIRVLFFVGINEGVIPRPSAKGGILSEIDREMLEEKEIHLSPSGREEMYQQRFYLYLNMTKPSERLYLSYCRVDASGATLLPSYLIGVVKNMYRDLEIARADDRTDRTRDLETGEGRVARAISGIQSAESGEPDAETMEILESWRASEEGRALLARLAGAVGTANRETSIGRKAAQELYGKNLVNSATRLEKFAACPFAHFAQYGLALEEREEYIFTPVDLGNVMHRALEEYEKTLQERHLSWAGLSEEAGRKLADEALDKVTADYGNTILKSTERNSYMMPRLRQILYRTVWALQKQIEQGSFIPAAFEKSFSGQLSSVRISLADGAAMRLTGRIDREDICDRDERRYIKIIDYKTGGTTFNVQKLYYGLQLQLVLYLNAAVEEERRAHPDRIIEPAGICYYRIQDPLIDVTGGKNKDIGRAMLAELRPNGFFRRESSILTLFDSSFGSKTSSDVLPLQAKKGGGLYSASEKYVGSAEEFRAVQAFADDKVRSLGRQIMDGEIGISPYKTGKETACSYCPYRGVCGFDERIPGFNFRELPSVEKSDLVAEENRRLQRRNDSGEEGD